MIQLATHGHRRVITASCALLAGAGCGRLDFTRVDSGSDASLEDASGVTCWPAWRSGAPQFSAVGPIVELALPDKQGNPWLTADGTTLYFDTGSGDTELYRTTRAGPGQPFGTPVHVSELSSPTEDTSLVIAADGRHAVISSTRPGSAGFDLWQVERAAAQGPFTTVQQTVFSAINTNQNEFDPFLTSDGLRLYYSASLATGGQGLFTTSRGSPEAVFATSVRLPGTGTNNPEADPDLSPDELVLVFAATAPLQLHFATRMSTAEPFGAQLPLTAIVAGGYDGDPALSADGCELFFISDRGGDRDLYRATVIP